MSPFVVSDSPSPLPAEVRPEQWYHAGLFYNHGTVRRISFEGLSSLATMYMTNSSGALLMLMRCECFGFAKRTETPPRAQFCL